ncbi:hypothetical protein WU86_06870 [Corynebacterium xerosis]|nr:hypothetical protein [Corynebacterium xerosis]KKO81865.1 hypothetical protein WU86_06870 [Corynebacterium xerosis]
MQVVFVGVGIGVHVERDPGAREIAAAHVHQGVTQGAVLAGADLGVADGADGRVEFREAVLAQDDVEFAMVAGTPVVDGVGLGADGSGFFVIIRGSGDRLDRLDDAPQFAGPHADAGQRLVVAAGAEIPEEVRFDGRDVLVGHRNDGGGHLLQMPQRQGTGSAEFVDARHAAQHDPDVAVVDGGRFPGADSGGHGRSMGIDVVVAVWRAGDGHGEFIEIAGACASGQFVVGTLGDPPFAWWVVIGCGVGVVVFIVRVMVGSHVVSPG